MLHLFIQTLVFLTLFYSSCCEPVVFNPRSIVTEFDSLRETIEKVECVEFKSLDGIYVPEVPVTPSATACGLYLVGEIDSRVKVEFLEFNVGCANGHLVGVLDGWEQRGNTFPPASDLSVEAARNRHFTYCGTKRPRNTFYSSGNFALIQYKLGQLDNFVIRVTFLDNLTPCNAVALGDEGQFELHNFLPRSNCSIMIIHPQQIQVSFMSVGKKKFDQGLLPLPPSYNALAFAKRPETSSTSCDSSSQPSDYAEVLGGINWSVPDMYSFGSLCGQHELMESTRIFCETTVVRLVSSGKYDNIVVIQHGKVKEEGTESASRLCPALLI